MTMYLLWPHSWGEFFTLSFELVLFSMLTAGTHSPSPLKQLFAIGKTGSGAKLLAGIGSGSSSGHSSDLRDGMVSCQHPRAMVLAYGFWNTIGKFFAPLVLTLVQATDPLNYKVPILTQWGFLGIMLPIFLWLPETPGE